jgi:rRNA-processing protein FCF1
MDVMKVLMDANFLMIPGMFKVDVFREMQMFGNPEPYTLDLVVKELESVARARGQDSRHAHMGLFLLDSKGVKVIKARGSDTDSEIQRIAKEGNFVVCTQDRELIKKLRKKGTGIITLRQMKYLIKI